MSRKNGGAVVGPMWRPTALEGCPKSNVSIWAPLSFEISYNRDGAARARFPSQIIIIDSNPTGAHHLVLSANHTLRRPYYTVQQDRDRRLPDRSIGSVLCRRQSVRPSLVQPHPDEVNPTTESAQSDDRPW